MNKLLSQLNGLYIPGNSKLLVIDGAAYPYTKAVQRILKWAQSHNEEEHQHFPIMGVSYGMLALIKS